MIAVRGGCGRRSISNRATLGCPISAVRFSLPWCARGVKIAASAGSFRRSSKVIEGLALQKPPLPLAVLFRLVQRLRKDLGEKAPRYGTVFSIIRDLGADLVTLAHEGVQQNI